MIALISPFLYALTNVIDKILLQRYFTEGGVGTLLIFSAVLSALAVPVLFLIDRDVLVIDAKSVAVLTAVGALHVLVLFFYLKALQNEDVAVTIVFYQLVPVFGLALGYFVLRETITERQGVAMALIIAGSSIMSFKYNRDRRLHLRWKTVGYMLAASFCWALGSVIFKAVALEVTVVRSLFWEHVALTAIGLGLFFFVSSYRRHFIHAVASNSAPILGLNVLNEILYILGNVIFSFAYMLGPIALVLLAEAFQPMFALIIGIVVTMFLPRLIREEIRFGHVIQRLVAIGFTLVGSYFLLSMDDAWLQNVGRDLGFP